MIFRKGRPARDGLSSYSTGHIPETPAPSRAFPILLTQNPGPGRSADADWGIYPPQVGVLLAVFTPTCKGHCPYAAFCGIPAPKVGVFFAIITPTFHLRIGKCDR